MSDGERETLTTRKKSPKDARYELARLDWENLFLNQAFLRTLFTIFDTAGMFTGNFQPDGRIHAFSEGRRSLGLDILRTAEQYLGPDALLRVLEAEKKTPQGGSNGRRSDGPDTDERPPREPGTGLQYLDYGPEG